VRVAGAAVATIAAAAAMVAYLLVFPLLVFPISWRGMEMVSRILTLGPSAPPKCCSLQQLGAGRRTGAPSGGAEQPHAACAATRCRPTGHAVALGGRAPWRGRRLTALESPSALHRCALFCRAVFYGKHAGSSLLAELRFSRPGLPGCSRPVFGQMCAIWGCKPATCTFAASTAWMRFPIGCCMDAIPP
jgi:hypothetical protein